MHCVFTHLLSILWIFGHFSLCDSVENVVKWVDEESAPGASLLSVREELKSSLSSTPNAKFQIVEQTVRSTSNSLLPTGSETADLLEVTSSGIIRQRKRIDREKLCGKSHCYIFVKIVMLPKPSLLSLLKADIHIRDINDNAPRFASMLIDLEVLESENVNHSINLDRFQATDDDMGNNSRITYSLSSGGSHFKIHHHYDERGLPHLQLILTKKLDYETVKVQRLTLKATDGGVKPLSNAIEIRVNVINVNDNSPVFDKKLYNVTLKEDYMPGYVITRVRATDKDRDNIQYQVKGSNGEARLIEVDHDTGVVKLRKKPDHKKHDKIKILIEATDNDVLRPRKANTVLLLNVDDVNDNDPVISINFIAEHKNNIVYVPESEQVGSYLAHVSASDADEGANGDVALTVETVIPGTESLGNLTEPGIFVMTNNLLATTMKFDRESRSHYDVRINACDGGLPPRCRTTAVEVVILDVNEFRPIFQHRDIQLKLAEDTAVGSVIAMATATDGDAKNGPGLRFAEDGSVELSKNGEIRFSLTPATVLPEKEEDPPIVVDLITGKITLIKALDYENRKNWQFFLFARDGGRPTTLQSRLKLNLTVVDVNDNRPVFTQPAGENRTVYASTLQKEKHFFQLKAMDFDGAGSSGLRYSIKVLSKDGSGQNRRKLDKVFAIDANEGTLFLSNNDFDDVGLVGKYKTVIKVTDAGIPPLTSSFTMYISVINTAAPLVPPSDSTYSSRGQRSSTLIIAGVACGAAVVVIVIIVLICLVRKRKSKTSKLVTKANDDSTSSTNTRTSSSQLGSPQSLRKDSRHSNICNTTVCDHSLGNGSSNRCHLCDIPNTPRAMHAYLEQQQQQQNYGNQGRNRSTSGARKSRGSHEASRERLYTATVSPAMHSPPASPLDTMSLGEKCTAECKVKGHSDRCWMPSSELIVSNVSSPSDTNQHHWKTPTRKDSSCSDTASSGISYYKMPNRRQSSTRHEPAALPDVVARSRHVTCSDESSLMSSATSSGASSSRPAKYSSFNRRSPNHRSLQKSNSDSGYDANLTSYTDKIIAEGCTEC